MQSFSKNMGIYSDRVGVLHCVAASPAIAHGVQLALQEVRGSAGRLPGSGDQQ